MKKAIFYTVLFSLSFVVQNHISACCRSDKIQKQNDVERIQREDSLVYRYTHPESGITTQVSSQAGVYSGYYYKWYLLPCAYTVFSQEAASTYFGILNSTFHNNHGRIIRAFPA